MKRLKVIKKKHSGRDATGQVVVRHQGGGQKQYLRLVDFRRDKRISGKVAGLEYDPNRNCKIALIHYGDGEKRYIIAPEGLKIGDSVSAGENVDLKVGNALPLAKIPMGTVVHNVEITAGKGGQIARGAGVGLTVASIENNYVQVKMPSGELRRIAIACYATIGQVGNIGWKDRVWKKAGANRHRGIRPSVRGVAMNPRSHPHGGGEGRSGIGMATPKTYAGRPAVGNTRRPKKYSNAYILKRRKSRS
jgi:large subunit ribosomal protein L2